MGQTPPKKELYWPLLTEFSTFCECPILSLLTKYVLAQTISQFWKDITFSEKKYFSFEKRSEMKRKTSGMTELDFLFNHRKMGFAFKLPNVLLFLFSIIFLTFQIVYIANDSKNLKRRLKITQFV
jgi:hypothetical protein